MNFNYSDIVNKGIFLNGTLKIFDKNLKFVNIIESLLDVKFNTGEEFNFFLNNTSELIYFYFFKNCVVFSKGENVDMFKCIDIIKNNISGGNYRFFYKNKLEDENNLFECVEVFIKRVIR